MKVWVGYLSGALESTVEFPEGDQGPEVECAFVSEDDSTALPSSSGCPDCSCGREVRFRLSGLSGEPERSPAEQVGGRIAGAPNDFAGLHCGSAGEQAKACQVKRRGSEAHPFSGRTARRIAADSIPPWSNQLGQQASPRHIWPRWLGLPKLVQ